MHEVDDAEGLTAICPMKRRHRATPIVTRFSMAMAERAGRTRSEGPWQTYPERMLRMRARSWTIRDAFADVLRGLQLREEVEDYKRRGGARPIRTPPGESNLEGGLRPHASPRPRLMAATGHDGLGRSDVSGCGQNRRSPRGSAGTRSCPRVNGSGAGHEPASAPDPSLLLKIDPTWGIQKVFHHYRAALTALRDQPRDKDEIAQFRQANIDLEQRLCAKLPARMKSLKAIYRKSGLKFDSGASRAEGG